MTAVQASAPKDAICVFCGSSFGKSPAYAAAAESLGRALALASTELVYGGGQSGLMGLVANACAEAGGEVHGILPSAFLKSGGEKGCSAATANGASDAPAAPVDAGAGRTTPITTGKGAGRTTVVATMHARKTEMAKLSPGGFVVLPGGYGSFEELFEMTTWSQLAIHRRKVLLLNVGGFYSPLREQIKLAVREGFITAKNEGLVRFLDQPDGVSDADWDWGAEALRVMDGWEWDESLAYKGLTWETS